MLVFFEAAWGTTPPRDVLVEFFVDMGEDHYILLIVFEQIVEGMASRIFPSAFRWVVMAFFSSISGDVIEFLGELFLLVLYLFTM